MLRASATAVPDHDAIIYLDRRITYAELYRSVRAGADGLRLQGVGSGDTVVIALSNCPEFVMMYFATALLRAKVYAIDPNAAEPELRRCIRDAEPALVLTHAMRAGTFERLLSERSDLRARIAVVGGDGGRHIAADELFRATAPERDAPPTGAYGGDWSYTYSSGSTGTPKRICRTQGNQTAEAHNITTTARITPQDRILCVVPLFHALGQFCCMIVAARAGAALVLLEQTGAPDADAERQLVLGSRIERVLEMIEEHRVTIMPAVPYIYELLADADERLPADVSSVRLFLSGGNFLPAATTERFLRRYGRPIRQTYGSSEAGSVAWDCRDADRVGHNSVGHPLDGVEVRVAGQDGRALPPGSVGEVIVGGASVMVGYADRPDLTAEVMSDGCYRTGDLGVLDEDGRLHITGRTNLLIDTGGRKVNPLEVEAVLGEHPGVAEVVVTGSGTRGGDEVLVAVVVPHSTDGSGATATAEELGDFCRARMTDYKVPHRFVFREKLPRSPLGKVLRRNLDLAEEQAAEAHGPGPGHARPAHGRAEVAAYLVAQLARLLRVPPERIDVDAPVLDTGLNSLMAMQLRLAVERDLRVPVQIGQLLSARSLDAVAEQLSDGSGGSVELPGGMEAEFPLAPAQLPYAGAVGEAAAYTCAARVEGDLDEAALHAALQELADRHPMLRLRLVGAEGGTPRQTTPRGEVDFTVEDVPEADRPGRIAALASAPPDLAGAGSLRVRLLRGEDSGPALVLSVHKAAADRWSLAVLLRDLGMVLGGQRAGGELYLPALPYSYQDFVRSAGEEAAAVAAGPVGGAAEVSATGLVLDADLAGSVRLTARREGVPISTVLLAALVATAAAEPGCGRRIGAVRQGRERAEFNDLVGRFARVVGIPGTGPDPTGPAEALPPVLAGVRDALDRPVPAAGEVDILFADDVEARPELAHLWRFTGGHSAEPVGVGDLRLHPVPVPGASIAAPVVCRLVRAGDTLSLVWQHDADRVPAKTLAPFVERFSEVLRAVVSDPAQIR
ncbi:AMP-binding protein [Streptomyces sp. NPDC060035]|uniref:class I adenylate-forming enzyme family protein n=1 Tax=Streptomyces sp. NPDC060035 TaxID=3347044 RepID=UPI0036C1DC4B